MVVGLGWGRKDSSGYSESKEEEDDEVVVGGGESVAEGRGRLDEGGEDESSFSSSRDVAKEEVDRRRLLRRLGRESGSLVSE